MRTMAVVSFLIQPRQFVKDYRTRKHAKLTADLIRLHVDLVSETIAWSGENHGSYGSGRLDAAELYRDRVEQILSDHLGIKPMKL